MNQPYQRALTVAEIEAALHALLTAIEAANARRALQAADTALVSFGELVRTNPATWRVADLTRDPVGRACREEIKRLGKLLFRVSGSTDAMRDSQARVAALNPAAQYRRLDIMDKWWAGVGAVDDVWCP